MNGHGFNSNGLNHGLRVTLQRRKWCLSLTLARMRSKGYSTVHNITGGPRPFSTQLFEMTTHIATWSSVCPIDCLQCSSGSFCTVWQQFRDEQNVSQRGSFRGKSPVIHRPEVPASSIATIKRFRGWDARWSSWKESVS